MTAEVALVRCADAAALAAAVAAVLAQRLAEADDERGHALLALSGGRSPVAVFEALRARALPWPRITVVPVDERCVAPGHADSNAALLRRHLLQGAAAAARFVPFFDALPAGELDDLALDDLAHAACRRLGDLPWPLDAALLGMGEDGHTASLFAGAAGLAGALVDPGPVAWTRPTAAPHARLTLTLPMLLQAGALLLPLAGAAKLAVFERARAAPDASLPISLLLHRAPRPVQVWTAPEA